MANTISNVTFAVGKVFDFILSNAHANSTFTVDFSLCDTTLGGKNIACLVAPTDKQVLSYDLNSQTWRPRSVNGLSYKGVWSSLPTLPAVGALVPGDYFIVSVANGVYNVGDWIVLNDDGVTFEQIENSVEVKSIFGRSADVVATEGDYQLDLLGDVDLTSPPILGDALVFDGTKWKAGAVSGGGGGGGAPSGAAGGDLTGTYPNPTIGNNKITDTHIANGAISQTKINGLTTSLSGKEPSITGAAATTYYRGDKTFVTLDTSVVPEGSRLYFNNARALGVLLAGFDNLLTGQVADTDSMLEAFGKIQNQINSLGSDGSNHLLKNAPDTLSGAISLTNVITATPTGDIIVNSVPLTLTSAVNQTYADKKLDKTTGGVVAGVVTLDNDLKIKGGSNYVTIKGNAATAGDYNFVLPTTAGTAGYFLSTDGSGVTSWASAGGGGAPTGAATGDLGGSYPAPTVDTVGGVTAASVAAGVTLANAATNANTANTIVKRDATGNFTATNVTGTVAVANGGTGATTLGVNELLFGNGTSAVGTLATTATPSILLSAVTTGAPTWTTSTAGNVLKGSVTGVQFGALAQSDLPAGSLSGAGTVNYVPYYNATNTLANSPLVVSGTNVGVGTATPGAKLEVAGQIKITGGTPGVGKILTSDAAGLATWTTPSTATPAGASGNIQFNNSGALGAEAALNYYSASNLLELFDSTIKPILRVNGGGLTSSEVGAGYLEITSSTAATSYASSSATVGSPAQAEAPASLFLQNRNGSDTYGSFVSFSVQNAASWFQAGYIGLIPTTGASVYTPNIVFGAQTGATSYQEHMRINGSGKVGIGTSSPEGLLHVYEPSTVTNIKTIIATSPNLVNNAAVGLTLGKTAASDDASYIQYIHDTTQSNRSIGFGHYGSSPKFIIRNDGGIGLGGSIVDHSNYTGAKMVINTSGYVGIGTISPTYQLQLSTDSAAKPGTSTWTIASDARLKDIRAPFVRGLDAILKINPIYFKYKADNELNLPSDKEYVGMIAQEAKRAVPESVSTDEKGYLHLNNDSIIWSMLNAIKELYYKFTDYEKKEDRAIASLKKEMNRLKIENENKDKKIQELEKYNLAVNVRLLKIEQSLKVK